MSFDHPWALLLLVALAPAWRWTSGRAARTAVVLLWLLLALGAAGPRWGAGTAPRAVWLLVDRSDSARAPGWQDAASALARRLDPTDRLGVVFYAGAPRLVVPAGPPAALAGRLDAADEAGMDTGASDLASALRFVDGLDGGRGEVVVLGDGRETRDGLYLPPPGRRIHVLPPPPRTDWRIRSVRAPERVAPGGVVALAIDVEATAAGEARVVLRRGREALRRADVALDGPGVRTLRLLDRAPADAAGTLDYRVELVAPDAGARLPGHPGNDLWPLRIPVGDTPRVAWVQRRGPHAPADLAFWRRALAGVARLDARAPARALADEPEVVVIDDVPAAALGPAQDALARWTEGGGAVLLLGGRRSLGDAGYAGGRLERAMPVHFAPEPPRGALAVGVLVDRSGSMNEPLRPGSQTSRLDLATSATRELLASLPDRAHAAVWAFAARPEAILPLGPADRPVAIPPTGGGTRLGPALRVAIEGLAASERPRRHLVLLSDGAADLPDAAALGRLLSADPKRPIVLTVLRLARGEARAEQALETLARRSGGQLLAVERIADLPRLTLDAYRQDARGLVVAPGRAARVVGGHALAVPATPLGFLSRTPLQPRGERLIEASGPGGPPLMARRSLPRGRTAFLQLRPSGADGWGAQTWTAEERATIGPLGAAAIRWLLDRPREGRVRWRTAVVDGQVTVEALTERPLSVRTDDGARTPLAPASPGLWRVELSLPVGVHGLQLVAGDAAASRRRLVSVPYSRELATVAPDGPRLRALASDSGGSVLATPARFEPGPPPRVPGRPVGATVLLAAVAALVAGAFLGRR